MRITNSMMTANTKANINTNKLNADRLNTMTASGQKITRPSDDPVVAIRAMRLNTSLTEVEQFYGKNIPDAEAWFTETETALSQTDDVLSDMREKLNQASSEDNVSSNVKDILEELKQLKEQFYAIGNADYAGRTVFTGYRTGEMLTFLDDDKINYEITENFDLSDLKTIEYISGKEDVNAASAINTDYEETKIVSNDVHRIRLSYDKVSDSVPTLSYEVATSDPANPFSYNTVTPTVKTITGKTQDEIDDIYTNIGDDEAVFIPETGEVLLGKSLFSKLEDAATLPNAKEPTIQITYNKEKWQKGDLRPEHYFQCKTPANPDDKRTYSNTYPDGIEYNYNRVDADGNPTTKAADTAEIKGFVEQDLTYEIAYNQSITINTHASDVYSHDIGRDIDELISITQLVSDSEGKISNLENLIAEAEKNGNDADKAGYEKMLAAANKENSLLKEKMHNMYTSAISSFKSYSDNLNERIAGIGALTARLDMTKQRVKDQKTNVKKLADDNINADISETALDYKNAQLALEAAQLAAGKIANQTLLNYI